MSSGRVALAAICLGAFMVPLDITIVVVALGDIGRELNADIASLQWIVDAYLVTFGCFVMAAGSLSDLVGRRRVLLTGAAMFGAASLLCGLATSATFLIAARCAQGIAGATLFSALLAALGARFRGPERVTAFTTFAAVMGVGASFGPFLGGIVVHTLGWRWAFLLNVPVCLLVIALALAGIDESRDPDAKRPDLAGMATLTLALALLIGGLITAGKRGFADGLVVAMLVGSLVAVTSFVFAELRQERPMVDLGLLRDRTFLGANLISMLFPGSFWAMLIYLPLFLQHVGHLSPLYAGFAVLPLTVPLLVVPPLAARMARILTPRRCLLLGPVLIALGLFSMAFFFEGARWQALLFPSIVAGVGGGLTNAYAATAAMTAVPPDRSGMASGINSTMRQVGFAAGVAVLGLVLTYTSARAITDSLHGAATYPAFALNIARSAIGGQPPPSTGSIGVTRATELGELGFTSGMTMIALVAAATALVGAALGWYLVRNTQETTNKWSIR